jgi:putative ABC transport system permease protein
MSTSAVYRALLGLLPADVLAVCGQDMERGFALLVDRARSRGRLATGVAWIAGSLDVLRFAVKVQFRRRVRAAVTGVDGGRGMNGGGRGFSMNALVTDVRYALRTLVRQPVFVLTAVLTLALGIGANAAIFSVVYGFLLRPLPYADGDELVMAWSANQGRGWSHTDVTLPDAWEWGERTKDFEEMALINRESFNVTGGETAERVEGKRVSANFFRTLRTPPAMGRDFEEADDRPGAPGVAILSWGFWQRRLGGEESALGSTLHLNGEPYTVIGVLSRDFTFSDDEADIFVPLAVVPAEESRTNHGNNAIARLRAGVTVERASRDVGAVAEALARERPETNEGWSAYVVSLHEDLWGSIGRQVMLVLMGAVVFVLLMSCVNVANLLLARASGRRSEMAVRAALGAKRGRMPALRASVASATELREEGRAGQGRRARRFGGSLVVTQTALAVVLLVGGGIMMRNVVSMQRQDFGYDPHGVLTARITPAASTYPDAAALDRFYDGLLERMRVLPGVEGAGTIQSLPLRGSNNVGEFTIEGDANAGGDPFPARMGYISPGYLAAMDVAIVRGRAFTDADRQGARQVVLVNESLVRRRFIDTDPIGRLLNIGGEAWSIVGIVPDMLERGVDRAPEPSIYLPSGQAAVRSRNIAIRTSGDPVALAPSLQREVRAIDPDQPIYDVQPMTALLDRRVAPYRLVAGLMLSFAIVSLLLGAVGIYGVTAYSVGRRTNEIGIRMAMGAARGGVVRMIVREGMLRSFAGIVIGIVLAVPLARAASGLLVGVSPNDPATFGTVVLVLATVAFLGAYLPARRAARLDPMTALRRE